MPDHPDTELHAAFMRALDLDRSEREEFVSGLDDATVRTSLRGLLQAADATDTFLETPILHAVTRPERPEPGPSSLPSIPGFEVLGRLASGGMATVYTARQLSPRREVAVKVIHDHLAQTSASRRFLFESELLATLRHPGIAQVFSAGTTSAPDGRELPYFVMELIHEARPISQYCQEAALSQAEVLDLFLRVCDAVGFGHQRGVIHRDLKPSNVLIDQDGSPKLIDFGIARSLEAADSDRVTLDVDRTRLIGTLNYMSPEQCESTDKVDTRSDVYALGVMLFELLTGQLPHDLRGLPLPEAVRRKQQVEPRPASAVTPRVDADLTSILAMSLEIDPDRRYRAADALADDVRRYLKGEPVRARELTTTYQLRKLAARHRTAVVTAGCFVLTLMGGIVATTWFALAATRAEHDAVERQGELEQVVQFQRAQLEAIDVAAMGASIRQALVGRGLVIDDINFTNLAADVLEESLLAPTHAAINAQFADRPVLHAEMLYVFAETMNKLGTPRRAEEMVSQAYDLRSQTLGPDHPDTLSAALALGAMLNTLGRYDDAIEVLSETHARLVESSGELDLSTLRALNALGNAYENAGRFREAEDARLRTLEGLRATVGPDHDLALVALNNLGVLRAVQGNLAGAEAAWRELLERRERIGGPDSDQYLAVLNNIGLLLAEQGDLEESAEVLERVLVGYRKRFGDTHPKTLSALVGLGGVYEEMGEFESALAYYVAGYEGRLERLGPDDPRTVMVRTHHAALLVRMGRAEESIPVLSEVLAWQREHIGERNGQTLYTRYSLARAHRALAHPERAVALLEEAVGFAASDAAAANCMIELASVYEDLGRLDDARETLERVVRALASSRGEDSELTREAQARLDALPGPPAPQ